jgi:hypothetical protein
MTLALRDIGRAESRGETSITLSQIDASPIGRRLKRPALALGASGLRSLALASYMLLASCSFTVQRIGTVETLYFGTAKAGGAVAVTDAEWQRFVDTEIAPRFPDGFTTWEAAGQWRTKDGAIERERTHIVQIIGEEGRREADIRAIIAAYKKLFAQESVLRVRSRAGIVFQ